MLRDAAAIASLQSPIRPAAPPLPDGSSVMTDRPPETRTLDATGLMCPLPVLRARKALKPLPAGAVLEVLATDPGSLKDFPAFCAATGHRLLSSEEGGGLFRFRIERAPDTSPA
jgi:tRNA 2-thiouridine synthesizing protein A